MVLFIVIVFESFEFIISDQFLKILTSSMMIRQDLVNPEQLYAGSTRGDFCNRLIIMNLEVCLYEDL
jgi:hypothetical protein